MVARFDGLIIAVETGVVRGRSRERERGLCASISSSNKPVRIISVRVKWDSGPIRHLK